jgi:trans-aconitate 2-methyltransferase
MFKHVSQLAGTSWDPGQYLKFSDHRLRPALELLARIPLKNPQYLVDLGCGTGHLTRILAERWENARVCGLDHSREMLEKARQDRSASVNTVETRIVWEEKAIEDWSPATPVDLIYSNATLHWVEDHRNLFLRLIRFLNKGGCLAVQMPINWDAPSHRLMRETLARVGKKPLKPLGSEELRQSLARSWVESMEFYYDLLSPHVAQLELWETEYLQVLSGENPVYEWVQASGLRPILHALEEEERKIFIQEYQESLRQAYPRRKDQTTLFPFRRLFFVAMLA